jgi:hypothetical protein
MGKKLTFQSSPDMQHLSDVKNTPPTDGQVPKFDSATGLFVFSSDCVNVSMVPFMSVLQPTITIPGGGAADRAFNDITIAGIPAGATLVSVLGGLQCRAMHNTNAGANSINGGQDLQVQKSAGGTYTTFFTFATGSLVTPPGGATRPTGDDAGFFVLGVTDVKGQVSANGTYNLKWTSALAALADLVLYDVQAFLVVTYNK